MTVTINITLTDQAKEAFPDDPAESFLYQDGVPLPQAGDFVELRPRPNRSRFWSSGACSRSGKARCM